jgi:hypothetical protein
MKLSNQLESRGLNRKLLLLFYKKKKKNYTKSFLYKALALEVDIKFIYCVPAASIGRRYRVFSYVGVT